MAYSPTTDFLALLRQTSGGVRTERMPGLDYIVAALARTGMITLSIGQTAPAASQAAVAWFKPAVPSWAAEGTMFLWNPATTAYEPATPALWAAFFALSSSGVLQDVAVAGPTAIGTNTTILRVLNVGAAVALTLPLASTKQGGVLVSDWANLAGTNNITITRSGADVLPNGATSWTIAGDGGSLFFRPLPGGGGYVL